jgi:hypothetical protein
MRKTSTRLKMRVKSCEDLGGKCRKGKRRKGKCRKKLSGRKISKEKM